MALTDAINNFIQADANRIERAKDREQRALEIALPLFEKAKDRAFNLYKLIRANKKVLVTFDDFIRNRGKVLKLELSNATLEFTNARNEINITRNFYNNEYFRSVRLSFDDNGWRESWTGYYDELKSSKSLTLASSTELLEQACDIIENEFPAFLAERTREFNAEL